MNREGRTEILTTKGRRGQSLDPQGDPSGLPPGLVLEVVDGPMDGCVAVSVAQQVSVGRTSANDLALTEDLLVSGRHAVVRRTGNHQTLEVEDLGSSNHTWIEGEALVTAHPIQAGQVFVLGGQSVIRLAAPTSSLPSPYQVTSEQLTAERSELLSSLSTNLNSALGAAAMLACQELRGYINERHLFLGLAMTEADQPLFDRGRGPVSEEWLHELHWRDNIWEEAPWVGARLSQIQDSKFFAYQRSWTPRLLRLLHEASKASRDRGRQRVDSNDLLRALITSENSRVHRWLLQRGCSIDGLLAVLDQAPAPRPRVLDASERTAPSRAEAQQAYEPQSGIRQSAQPSQVDAGSTDSLYFGGAFSSGDLGLDNRAQEAGRQLYGFAALYQLAEAGERRQGMRKLLEEHMADVPTPQRRQWLEQLRRLFPLDRGSTQASNEIEQLQRRVAALTSRVAELEADLGGHGGNLPWHVVLGTPSDDELASLSPSERPRVELLREVFQFGQHLEKAITAMVQDLNTGLVTSSTILQLPGHRTTLRDQVSDIEAGRQVSLESLRAYLADLRTWLAAGMVAFDTAPEEWFKEFWGQYSPRAIETQAEGGFARFGPNLWNRYKEAARRISPDIAAQHVRRKAQEIAKNQYRQFSERRSSSG